MTTRPPLLSSVWLMLALLMLGGGAAAQDAAALRDRVQACAAEPRDPERLACYDALAKPVDPVVERSVEPSVERSAEAIRADRSGGTAAAPSRTQPATDDAGSPGAADFGLPRAREPRRAEAEEPREILSTVAALREIQPGRLEITLANGQVWRQANTDRYPLQVGHEVRVYPTRFGTLFRLTAVALRSFVQVERVR